MTDQNKRSPAHRSTSESTKQSRWRKPHWSDWISAYLTGAVIGGYFGWQLALDVVKYGWVKP